MKQVGEISDETVNGMRIFTGIRILWQIFCCTNYSENGFEDTLKIRFSNNLKWKYILHHRSYTARITCQRVIDIVISGGEGGKPKGTPTYYLAKYSKNWRNMMKLGPGVKNFTMLILHRSLFLSTVSFTLHPGCRYRHISCHITSSVY